MRPPTANRRTWANRRAIGQTEPVTEHRVVTPDLVARARAWAAADPDPETRAAIVDAIAADDPVLCDWFGERVGFGTAGLRATMGPGPARLNRLVVRQATVGLMRWLPDGAHVVVGHDARHRSAVFAADTAAVIAAAGGRAELLGGPVPTPVLAHHLLDVGADAGIVITASHNPAADNGYKLYLADGIQLVSPADLEISAEIVRAAETWDEVDPAAGRPDEPLDGPPVTDRAGAVASHRGAALAALTPGGARDVRLVYSAMHGVGGEPFLAALEAGGFAPPIVVAEQFSPDPDFPTAEFPNPEEPGALDLALDAARDVAADAVVAHDPDADRLALAVAGRDGEWVRLSGDQVGVLLADHLLRRSDPGAPAHTGRPRVVARSVVSSRLLDALAAAHDTECVVTLTGFKWVARPIVDRPDADYVLGYEEALGYCVGARVHDKDGITAGVVAAEMLATLAAAGATVWDRLDELAAAHGVHLTAPVTVRLPGADGARQRQVLLDQWVARPPTELVDAPLRRVENLADGARLPATPGLIVEYADHTRVIVRPSGTEPKLKVYIEVIEDVDESLEQATRVAEGRLAAYRSAIEERLRPE